MLALLAPWLARAYQDALLEEAERNRMVALSRANKPRLEERVLVGLGARLISMGLRLQARYRPEMRPASESCGPACG